MKTWHRPLTAFWNKINNDWIFNLSGLLAFNFLLASFPLLLVLLAIVGFTFGAIDAHTEQALIRNLAQAFPSQTGTTLIDAAISNLRRSAGVLLALGIIMAIFFSSRMFIVIENCFGIIYRLRAREIVQQNLIALGLLVLYIILIPLVFLASIVPNALIETIVPTGFGWFLAQVLSSVGTLIVAVIGFGILYLVVPNRRFTLRGVWPGTVIAAILLVAYEKLFPLYTQAFLRPNNYGSIAGFAIVILLFYNYLAFILLLGAEVNSWVIGERETIGDLQTIVSEIETTPEQQGTIVDANENVLAFETNPVKPKHANDQEALAKMPQSRISVRQALRGQQRGRTIFAGQIAALGLISVSLLIGLIRRMRKAS